VKILVFLSQLYDRVKDKGELKEISEEGFVYLVER
jgi:hypothetical protein